MTRLSRLVLGAVLLAGLSSGARAAEPDKLTPATADTVISVNLKQIVESDFAKKYVLDELKKQIESQTRTKKILADIGLDPFKDVERLVVCSMDTQFGGMGDPSMLMIFRGKFDAEKMFKTAEAEAKKSPDEFSMIKDGGTILFKYQPADGTPTYATVIDDKTVIASSEKKYITAAIKAADAGKPAPLKKELADLIKKADDKASVYIASVVSGKLGDLGIPDEAGPFKLGGFNKALPKTESALVTVRITADVSLDVAIGMKDEEAANDMRNALTDVIDQAKPLAKLVAGLEPQAKSLPDLLDALKITSKNKDMIITAKLAGGDVGSLLELAGSRGKKKDAKKEEKKD